MKYQRLLILTLVAIWCGSAHAESERPVLTWNGFVDGYYAFNFNQPAVLRSANGANASLAASPPANNLYRYYDVYHDQLSLSLAEVTIKAAYRDVSFLSDFDFGTYADLNATTLSASGPVVDESTKHLGQAVLTYRSTGSPFGFDLGKMYSHMGVETAKSKDNFNYSRSLLFSYGIPFWHTGARLFYEVIPGKFESSLYVYNGWNTAFDVNRSKTLGAQLHFAPSTNLALTYNFIGGPERSDSESDWRSVHELNASFQPTKEVSVLADAILGAEDNAFLARGRGRAQWSGALVALKYQWDSLNYLSPRYEIYHDSDGATLGGLPQSISSATLTYGHEVTAGFSTRLEVRGDFSDVSSFPTGSGVSSSQITSLVAGLFVF